MKVHKVFDRIVALLEEMNLIDKASCISQAGIAKLRKIFKDIRNVKQEDLKLFFNSDSEKMTGND